MKRHPLPFKGTKSTRSGTVGLTFQRLARTATAKVKGGVAYGVRWLRRPAVCAALDAKKFQEEFGLRLVDRLGSAQSWNVVFVFCRDSDVERAASSETRREIRDQGERQKSDTGASRTHLDRVRVDRSIVDDTVFLVSCVAGKRGHRCAGSWMRSMTAPLWPPNRWPLPSPDTRQHA